MIAPARLQRADRGIDSVLNEDAVEARTLRTNAAMAEPISPATEIANQNLHWWSSPRKLLRYVLSLDDTAHHIALGPAMGLFIGLTPTVGIQMFLAVVVYYMCLPFFRFNCKAAVVTVYVSNPLTMLPLYWFDYRVGQVFFGGDVTKEQLKAILTYEGFAGWWHAIWTLFVDLGWTMLAGSLIVGAVGGLVTYPVMRYLLRLFRSDSGRNVQKPPPSEAVASAERRSA
jgi:uncharacterized protein (DUF2062 family)